MASRRITLVLIPEIHTEAGEAMLHSLIPLIKELVTSKHDKSHILNVTEGKEGKEDKEVPGLPPFYKALYAPEKEIRHMFEWDETSPDVASISYLKFVLTIITIINAYLGHVRNLVDGGINLKTEKRLPGIQGHTPPREYIELVYTQMFEGHKVVPIGDVLCTELSQAFKDMLDGNKSPEVFNKHVDTALGRLLQIFDEKEFPKKEVLKGIISDILAGGDSRGRQAPIERARVTLRELNDERFLQQIERYVLEHPEITHVLLNIGLSHYKNTVALAQRSPLFKVDAEMNSLMKELYGDFVPSVSKGGSRKRRQQLSRKQKQKQTQKKKNF